MARGLLIFKTRHLLVLLGVLILGFLLFLSVGRKSARSNEDPINNITPFVGQSLEASGVVGVPGTDGALIVDNGRAGQVFWMTLDQNGKQTGAIRAVGLGVDVEDIEGITSDGTYFYVANSQSRPRAIASAGLARFKFDGRNQSISGVESITGLKSFLMANVAELRNEGDRKSKDGGLNIEGLAWDPHPGRLLLGLRSPIVDGDALLIPLKLRNRQGPFSIDNLEVEGSKAIRLPLGGIGVRGIEYDARRNVFMILSGAAEDQSQTDFGLWEWNGDQRQRTLRETNKFAKQLKPEGIARAKVGNRDFAIVVFDAGGYTILGPNR